jgi:hypothetical protein
MWSTRSRLRWTIGFGPFGADDGNDARGRRAAATDSAVDLQALPLRHNSFTGCRALRARSIPAGSQPSSPRHPRRPKMSTSGARCRRPMFIRPRRGFASRGQPSPWELRTLMIVIAVVARLTATTRPEALTKHVPPIRSQRQSLPRRRSAAACGSRYLPSRRRKAPQELNYLHYDNPTPPTHIARSSRTRRLRLPQCTGQQRTAPTSTR